MRRPDRYTQAPGIASNGAHIPATLQYIGTTMPGSTTEQALATIASRLSDLVPVTAVRVRQDDVRQLLSLELEERSGFAPPANSVSDGTLRFLALAALAEGSAEGVFCMEEPENGIHPANLEAMNLLLHDIAVDPTEPVGNENPMRQIVVATYSPYFVQLQHESELVLAKKAMRRNSLGTIEPLVCHPCLRTWRSSPEDPGVAHIALQSYLCPHRAAGWRFKTSCGGLLFVHRDADSARGGRETPRDCEHGWKRSPTHHIGWGGSGPHDRSVANPRRGRHPYGGRKA